MRPRISQDEAQYIVSLLDVSSYVLTEKEKEINRLSVEVKQLRDMILLDTYKASQVFKIREKKERLKKLEILKFNLYSNIELHIKLREKYLAIAENKPHDGRYKSLSTKKRFRYTDSKSLTSLALTDTSINAEEEKQISEYYEKYIRGHVPNKKFLGGIGVFR